MTERSAQLSADEPIRRRTEDLLGRDKFAALVAAQLVAAPSQRGFVLSVMGPWGSGKTSVLNLVEEELDDKATALRFNPWLFSGAEQLVARFFAELGAQLGSSEDRGRRKLANRFVDYGNSVTPIMPVILGRTGTVLAAAFQAGGRLRDTSKGSALDQYRALEGVLRELDRRFVVFIDDIDRLEDTEVREVVRLVKLVGALPRISYVLAFDRRRVELALGNDAESGRDYLEKIVQAPHSLPVVAPAALRRLALDELDHALGDRQLPHFNAEAWNYLFAEGIGPMLETLRDARRYANVAPAAVYLFGDEVASQDVLALEALRLFDPDVHANLPLLADTLTGPGSNWLENRERADAQGRESLEPVLNAATHKDAVETLLRALFPAAAHLLGGGRGAEGRTWRAQRRVASREVLDVYLHAVVADDQLATVQVENALEALSHADSLRSVLDGVSDGSLGYLFERLRDHSDRFPPAGTEAGALVLLGLEGRLPDEPNPFKARPASSLRFLIEDLAQALPQEKRPVFVRWLYENAPSLSMRWRVLNMFGTFGTDDEGRRPENLLLDETATEELSDDLRGRTARADARELSLEREALGLLTEALRSTDSAIRDAVDEKLSDDAVFAAALRGAFGWIYGTNNSAYRQPALNWRRLEGTFGKEMLVRRTEEVAASLDRGSLDERDTAALELAEKYAAGETPPEW